MQYIVTVPNPKFDGKTLGVQFNAGKALLAEQTLDPRLGLNVEQVAALLTVDFGYTVTTLEGQPYALPRVEPKIENKKSNAGRAS